MSMGEEMSAKRPRKVIPELTPEGKGGLNQVADGDSSLAWGAAFSTAWRHESGHPRWLEMTGLQDCGSNGSKTGSQHFHPNAFLHFL